MRWKLLIVRTKREDYVLQALFAGVILCENYEKHVRTMRNHWLEFAIISILKRTPDAGSFAAEDLPEILWCIISNYN